MSVLLSGLTVKYVPGTPGIVLNLIWLFMNGIGVRTQCIVRLLEAVLLILRTYVSLRVLSSGGHDINAYLGILR